MKFSMMRVVGSGALAAAVLGAAISVSAQTASSTCPLSLGFMKLGAANKVSDVAKLQSFLKVSQGSDVDVTGIFDQKTEDAVSAFQRANMSDVMGPWGATRPSGIVYLTTSKVIDKIACGVPLALDDSELAIIDSYKSAAAMAAAGSDTTPVVTLPAPGSALDSSAAGPVLDPNMPASGQQAAAADSSGLSVFTRFIIFLRGLFSR